MVFKCYCSHSEAELYQSPTCVSCVLVSFCYLASGGLFDKEATIIHLEVHHLSMLVALVPQISEQASTHVEEFSKAGCHGCVGSSDPTHIAKKNAVIVYCIIILVLKSKLTIRKLKRSMSHHWYILSTTLVYSGRWNNKTLDLFDNFLMRSI